MNINTLAIDLGASSGRAMFGSYDGNTISYKELLRWDNNPSTIDGELCWDFDLIMDNVYKAISLAAPFDIESIGIDSWGVDYGLLKKGKLIHPVRHYRDGRAQDIFDSFKDKSALYDATGIQPMRINTVFSLLDDKRKGLLDKADKMLFVPDLIAYHLTGEYHCETSIASTSGLLGEDGYDWNYPLIDKLKLPRSLFPKVMNNCSVYGYVTEDVSFRLGIGNIPVCAVCCHDTASAAACVDGKDAFLSLGTWALLGVRQPRIDISDADYTNERGLLGEVTYLTNITGMWITQQIRRALKVRGEDYSFARLEEECELDKLPSLIDVSDPIFDNPSDMLEAIDAYCECTVQPTPKSAGEYVATAYASLALKLGRCFDKLSRGRDISKITVLGGGGQSAKLCSLIASACDTRISIGHSESTMLGNVLVQLYTLGYLPDIDAGLRALPASGVVYSPDDKDFTDELYERYDAVLAARAAIK